MSRLIIARHGDTFAPGEPIRRIGCRTDLPLVDSGIAQARRLGDHLRRSGFVFDTVLTSALSRTRETAALIITRQKRHPIQIEADWLSEIDHGPDEGQLEEHVRDRLGPSALGAWEAQSIPPPGWIVDADVRLAAWRNLFDQPPVGATLLITSNGAARFALDALDAPCSLQRKLSTGAFGLLEMSAAANGSSVASKWRISSWNVRP